MRWPAYHQRVMKTNDECNSVSLITLQKNDFYISLHFVSIACPFFRLTVISVVVQRINFQSVLYNAILYVIVPIHGYSCLCCPCIIQVDYYLTAIPQIAP